MAADYSAAAFFFGFVSIFQFIFLYIFCFFFLLILLIHWSNIADRQIRVANTMSMIFFLFFLKSLWCLMKLKIQTFYYQVSCVSIDTFVATGLLNDFLICCAVLGLENLCHVICYIFLSHSLDIYIFCIYGFFNL